MDPKRVAPGRIITGIGIALALLTLFGSNLSFAPTSLFLPFMMILVGRAISRGANAGTKSRRPSTIFNLPTTVPPPSGRVPREPTQAVPQTPSFEVVVPPAMPTPAPQSDADEKLRAARAAAEKMRAAEAAAKKAKELDSEPLPKTHVAPKPQPVPPPAAAPSSSHAAVYPSPTPSSARTKSSREMVEEAKKRLKRS